MSDETKLLPCPFCGGSATIRADADHSAAFLVGCTTDGCFGCDHWEESYAEAIAAWNTRALTTSQPTDPVTNAGCCQPAKVKPLVWVDVGTDSFNARTPFGDYVVELHDQWGMWSPDEDDFASEARSWHMTETAAKSAAQADYDTRAALVVAPMTLAKALQVPEVQVLVEAAMVAKLALAEHEPHPLSACQSLLAALRPFKGGKA